MRRPPSSVEARARGHRDTKHLASFVLAERVHQQTLDRYVDPLFEEVVSDQLDFLKRHV